MPEPTDQGGEREDAPQPNHLLTERATVAACRADYTAAQERRQHATDPWGRIAALAAFGDGDW